MAETARTNARLLALIVSIPTFMGVLDSTVFVTALPQMAKTFDIPPVNLSIGITGYLLVQAALLPASNWIADRFGARTVLSWAIVGFTLSSAMCGLAQHFLDFMVARVFQAIAATLMVPVGRLVLLRSTSKSDLVNVVTITTIPMLFAPTLGPPVGGFITTYLSWPWIFYINVPFGIASILLALRYVPNIFEEKKTPLDVVGFLTTATAISCLLYGMDRISAPGVDWRFSAAFLAVGGVFSVYALRHARSHPHPLLSFAPFKTKPFFVTTISGGALVRLPMRSIVFILPLLFQIGFGMSAFRSGLFVMMLNVGDLALKPFLPRLFRRVGFHSSLMVGTFFMMLTILVCAFFQASTPVWIVMLILALSGVCRSMVFGANMTLAYAELPQEEIGNATMFTNVMQPVLGAAGTSLAAILINLSINMRGAPAGDVGANDCRFALIGTALIGMAAMAFYHGLPRNAGAEASGHRKYATSQARQ